MYFHWPSCLVPSRRPQHYHRVTGFRSSLYCNFASLALLLNSLLNILRDDASPFRNVIFLFIEHICLWSLLTRATYWGENLTVLICMIVSSQKWMQHVTESVNSSGLSEQPSNNTCQSVHSKHPLSAFELSRTHNRTWCAPDVSRFNFCLYSGTKWATLWSERPRGGLHSDWNASGILLKERSIVWLSHDGHVRFLWRFGRRPVMSQALKSPNTNTAWSPDLFIALL